ncbi:retrovirus-related pol polyprotein from transposon TNT 1-94 [Tanacetum coccineum]
MACLILGSMSPELQWTLENYKAYDMIQELKTIPCLKTGRWSASKPLSLEDERLLRHIGMPCMGKTIAEIHAMLKLHEKTYLRRMLLPLYSLLGEAKIPLPTKRDNPEKDSICHHYKEVGHWRRNCPAYHADLKKRKNSSMLVLLKDEAETWSFEHSFWGYALESTAHIINMVPTKMVDKTSYEIWNGKAPNLSYLKVSGCEALVKRDTPDKLKPKTVKCIFIGYPKETMGYYFYNLHENKIFFVRYAKFFENSLTLQEASDSRRLLEMSGSDIGLELIQEDDT